MKLRNIVIGAVAVAAIGGAVWVSMQPEVVPVDIADVASGPMEVTVNADGTTRVRDVYEVAAPVSGTVQRSPVTVGDSVVAGETVIARIEPGELAFLDERARKQAEAAVAQAQAALALSRTQIRVAEADLNNAQRQLNRVFDLHERGTAPDAQLEQAETAVDIASATLDSAHATADMRESEVSAARAVLTQPGERQEVDEGGCCVDLRAPVSGTVLSVTSRSARPVTAGTALVSIGPTDDLEIVVELLSTDAVRLATGVPAHIERWGGDGALEARVREIEPAAFTKVSALGIEEQRVRVVLDFAQDTEVPPLGHNFRVYARIVEWSADNALQVPISALFREGDDWAVFTVEEGAARLTPVEIGRRNADVAELRSGLEAGDTVITHPSDRVSDGTLVEARAAGN
ncbi:HlyD family efflux transporter periplasmic adaptor subunit [Maritimibacter sp. UBA3975]|uniref:efflux RND transporter periplasmic adaptor subunit n=1 Tax=Maritimibacter sp. UBA3975 TaxID=1946833 RepID=UPI000C0B3467|nr:HlyD family efflux transporter periplasmic adaptor subunit [Maritimibacter sp. UBA3975]MAM61482.1 RND transporter [Maritimibacter sp.]|tara:strand:- start:42928 stop:44136 length:1209 start_codon:yes stop_codon:yes gene_type:complete